MKKVFICMLVLYGFLFGDYHTNQISKQEYNQGINIFSSEEFSSFNSQNTFEISSGSIYIDNIGKFSDGKYKLVNTDIEQIGDNHFFVTALFKMKRKKYISYQHIEHFSVIHDERRLWIKHKGRAYKYGIPSRHMRKNKQHKRKYIIKNTKLNISISEMNLILKLGHN